MKELSLTIGGMHCVMCSAALERALKKLNGVQNATVSYASESAHIIYDETKLNQKAIAKCVKKTGYTVVEDKTKYQQRQFTSLLVSFVISAILTLPFLVEMILMFAAPNSELMHMLHNGWLQFVLATLVEFGIAGAFLKAQ